MSISCPELPPPISIETPAEDLGIHIIYEDQDLLILKALVFLLIPYLMVRWQYGIGGIASC